MRYGNGPKPKRQPRASIESYRVPVVSDVDPTGMVVGFAAVVDGTVPTVSTSFTAGSWDTAAGWVNGVAYAYTPLIGPVGGAGVALELAVDVDHDLWWRIVTADGAVPVRKFDQIRLV